MSLFTINQFIKHFCVDKKTNLEKINVKSINYNNNTYIIELFDEEKLFIIKYKLTESGIGHYRSYYLVNEKTGAMDKIDFNVLTGNIVYLDTLNNYLFS